MSREGLELAVGWERFVGDLLDRTSKFPKALRYVLGQRLDEAALDVAEQLVEAQYTRGERRARSLREINLRLSRIRLLVRLAHARRCLDPRAYEHCSREIDAFGRGIGGGGSS